MRSSVLVVDDETSFVDLITDILEDEGFAVTRAYDGLQAVRAIQRRLPDLVIADVTMPRMDGLSLARALRNQDIPVVLMSASRRDLSDFDGRFLPKPFDLDELVALAHEMTESPVATSTSTRAQRPTQARQVSAGD